MKHISRKNSSPVEYTPEHISYVKNLRKKNAVITLSRVGLLLIFLLLWELLAKFNVIDSFISSSPSRMWACFVELVKNGELGEHVGITLLETVISFFLATTLGTLIAIVLWWFEGVRRVLEPYVVVLNALPKIALGPIIIIWMGTDMSSIITMALAISLFVTILNTLSGFLSVEKSKLMLMQTLGANKWQTLTKLVLPSNIPNILDALKINVGMCWVGTIMGEYLVSHAGLGYLIIYGGQIFKLDLVMTSTVILCFLAGGMYYLVALLQKIVSKKLNIEK
ncbi:MAG: ABC transporter permease [Clostridia bacterium]|nr:ABC transporter permease [Clostridia bacterium]